MVYCAHIVQHNPLHVVVAEVYVVQEGLLHGVIIAAYVQL